MLLLVAVPAVCLGKISARMMIWSGLRQMLDTKIRVTDFVDLAAIAHSRSSTNEAHPALGYTQHSDNLVFLALFSGLEKRQCTEKSERLSTTA